MRYLYLMFKNADGSRKTLIIRHCHQNLSPEIVRQAMVEIMELAIFEKNGVRLCTEIIGAKYVERRVTVIFDNSANLGPKRLAVPKNRFEELGKIASTEVPQLHEAPTFLKQEANLVIFNSVKKKLADWLVQFLYTAQLRMVSLSALYLVKRNESYRWWRQHYYGTNYRRRAFRLNNEKFLGYIFYYLIFFLIF